MFFLKFSCVNNNVKIEDKYNFYKNPLPIIFENLDSLMPIYLWLIYILLIVLEFLFHHLFNLSSLKLDVFLNSSIAGLSLIPVLFGATVGIFKNEDLIKLVIFKREKDKKYGKAFNGIIAPFVLASIIFLTIGSSSLLFSAIKPIISISFEIKNIIKLIYLDILLFGIFILFGTVVCIFQIYYNNIISDTEDFLNKKHTKKMNPKKKKTKNY